ncbi:MAG: hypothetical protein K2H86_04345 [Muribaculaceae bacterium]|nr:hypothetical protein [Muribaculaceae bacterium]
MKFTLKAKVWMTAAFVAVAMTAWAMTDDEVISVHSRLPASPIRISVRN